MLGVFLLPFQTRSGRTFSINAPKIEIPQKKKIAKQMQDQVSFRFRKILAEMLSSSLSGINSLTHDHSYTKPDFRTHRAAGDLGPGVGRLVKMM